ncbi:hypothetical protein CLU81_3548 [Flavobacterium sp. 9]|uniref:hypothetical protein n=1 Tax=Flavobacterium sp. 9 TaxID=2035198 RepID=UPI000C1900BD|nr:hypothetical protein [Flavobacterium sp. 9]PIF32978.1 hypothetical protein CLU81_3548 [Flavobacterium sp. 9]
MGLIQIIANNFELDFVNETLSIKTDNNALSRDFKVSASSYPFLVIENKKTKMALGTRDIASVRKKKVVNVTVIENGIKFTGELQILSYIPGYRKCNIKYSSAILTLMNKKIADFMPVLSVIPDETNPVPFSEKTDSNIVGSEHWKTFPLSFLGHCFPTVKFQFPTMKWLNKFGVKLESDDPWYLYKDKINEYNSDGLVENKFTIVSDVCTVENKNVVAPQVFLLAPAFYALQTLGFTMGGDFPNSEFIKRLLFYSSKNNLTETHPIKAVENLSLPTLTPGSQYNDEGELLYDFFYSFIYLPTTVEGTYIFEYEFVEPEYEYEIGLIDQKLFTLFLETEPIFMVFRHSPGMPANVYKGTVKIEVSADQVGSLIHIKYYTPINALPTYSIKNTIVYPATYFQMHPTIQLGRYLPDWTFGTYLNEIQNLFNLEINSDDFTKKITLDFNEETIEKTAAYIEKKSLIMTSYEQAPYNAFLLKYDNEQDEALWITTESVEVFDLQTSNFSQNLSSKFKYVPITFTADLSEDLDSKNGTGLMIYDPENKPYISSDFLGQTLKMNGEKGIYKVFWKKFLKFLLNSSGVELTGPYTETELRQIMKLKRIFIDHQEYIIASTEYTETQQNLFKVKFSLQSINF